MNKKLDYSKFYISMILILVVLFASTTVYNKYKMHQHLQKDLDFAKETAEFIVYEAEIIGYCANMSNLSNEDLLTKFMEHKAAELIKETFNEGKGLEYDANVATGEGEKNGN